MDSNPVIIHNSDFLLPDRAGLLFENSGGQLFNTPGNSFIGTENDFVTDGALPVPEAPPIPEY